MIKKRGDINPRRDQKKISDAIERELMAFGLLLEKTAKKYLADRNINVDNDLSRSIISEVERILEGLRLQFGANAKHGIFVHEGTKPHWPPVKPIRRWVVKKLNLRGREADSATWCIRKKISEVGTKAKPFLSVAVRAHINKLGGRIGRAIERGIDAGAR